MTLDAAGDLVITGGIGYETNRFLTVKYNNSGSLLLVPRIPMAIPGLWLVYRR